MRALLVLLLTTLAAWGADYTHPESKITLPEFLGGLMRGEVKEYPLEKERLKGVAIPYANENTQLTVFLRKAEKDDTAAKTVDATIAEVRKPGSGYSDLKLYRSSGEDKAGWAKGAFSGKADGTDVMSFVYAVVVNGYLVKIRATTSDRGADMPGLIALFQDAIDKAAAKKP